MDLTQVLTDFKRFERSIIWYEYWYGRDSENEGEKPIFRIQKNNVPKNHTTPEGLKVFLNSIKSVINDPKKQKQRKLQFII